MSVYCRSTLHRFVYISEESQLSLMKCEDRFLKVTAFYDTAHKEYRNAGLQVSNQLPLTEFGICTILRTLYFSL